MKPPKKIFFFSFSLRRRAKKISISSHVTSDGANNASDDEAF